MSTTTALLNQFCRDHGLVDLSPMANLNLPSADVRAIMWDVLQMVLPVEEQRSFLRGFCAHSQFPMLRMLVSLITADINEEQCNSSFGIIQAADGVDADFTEYMRDFFQTNLSNAVALMDRENVEDIVYSIDHVYHVVDERMVVALDELKFQANPGRFAGELDRETKDWNDFFAARMKLADEDIATLTAKELAKKLSLERELAGSPTPRTSPGGARPLSFGAVAPGEKRSIEGPNGFMYERKKRCP